MISIHTGVGFPATPLAALHPFQAIILAKCDGTGCEEGMAGDPTAAAAHFSVAGSHLVVTLLKNQEEDFLKKLRSPATRESSLCSAQGSPHVLQMQGQGTTGTFLAKE